MFGALFRETVYQRVYEQAVSSDVYAAAAAQCGELAIAAFRCADVHGFRDPTCLHRRTLHARCVANLVAPEFLDRLEHCETTGGGDCATYERDVVEVAGQRMKHHAESMRFTAEEERGVRECGLPRDSHSRKEFEARLQCLAPRVCPDSFARTHACFAASRSLSEGACAESMVQLAQCMGESHARLQFH
jgi:hypothetical protein